MQASVLRDAGLGLGSQHSVFPSAALATLQATQCDGLLCRLTSPNLPAAASLQSEQPNMALRHEVAHRGRRTWSACCRT